MRGYDRDDYGQSGDEYEDYEDDEDGEGYEEEEEDPKPTKEALAYLELRQRLKEQLRKKKSGSSLANSNNKKKKLPYDNFGSFFGPSQPVIAERVIQESKSLLETKHLTSSSTNSVHHNKKSSGSTSAVTKSVSNDQKPKVINEVKSKVQKIKDTRDYSFLLSDDAEPPAPTKDRPPQNASVSNSEVRSSQMATNNGRHIPSSNNGRHIPSSNNGRHIPSSNNGRHIPSSNNGRPVPSSNNGRHVPSANNGRHLPSANNGRHVPSANNGRHVPSANNGRVVPGHRDERKLVSTNGQMHSKVGPNKLSSASRRPDATSMDSRRQLGSNGGNGPGRPLETKRLPSKMPASTTERKASTPGLKNPMSGVPTKPPLSKLQSSIPRQQLQQKKEVRESNKPKVLPKQSSGLSRPQHVNKPQMQRQISSHPVSHERPPKKKPMRQHPDDDEPGLDFRSEIRKMFRQPARYASDDDDSDMEANFEDIMKEERRSALIARREDEEQARLIEEEERRERMAKQNRKRKLGH